MQYKRIGELAKVVTGGTPSTRIKDYWNNGTIPWLQSGCCQNSDVKNTQKFITELGYANSNTVMMPKNTVMIALTGATAGKVGYLMFDACGNQSITGILPNDFINQRFLFYYLIHKRPQILNDCIGGAQPHISQSYVKNIKFPLISIIEQEKISQILLKLDFIISLRKQQLAALDTLIKARFVEMFGELGNQLKYDTIELGSISYMISGGTPSSKHSEYFGGNIPFISTPCLGPNYIDSSAAQNWLTKLGVENSSTHIVPENSLMVGSRVGVGKCSINTCAMCTNQDILSFVGIDIEKYDLLFVKKVIEQYAPFFETQKRGATIKGIPSGLVKASQIPLAPVDIQRKFASFVRQTDKSKVVVQKALDEAQILFDSLLQQYFG